MIINFNILKKIIQNKIKLFILDIDGCSTNGQVNYLENEQNIVFSVYDGEAIIELLKKIDIIVISGRGCLGTLKRCLELGIKRENIFLECKNKREVIEEYLKYNSDIKKENIIAIGDQSSDLPLIDFINIFVCPRNTKDFNVLKNSDYITFNDGGNGAIFELYKLIENFL